MQSTEFLNYSDQLERARDLVREYGEALANGQEPAFPMEAWILIRRHASRAGAGQVDAEPLLDIARASGLRGLLHGVNATLARQVLRDFVDALDAHRARQA